MNTEVQTQAGKYRSKKVIVISLLTFIILMISITAQLTYTVLKNDKIYKGVYVGNLYVGELSKQELYTLIKKNYEDDIKDQELVLKSKNLSKTVSFSDMNVTYDVHKAVEEAYAIGRNGNIFSRLHEIYTAGKNKKIVDIKLTIDSEKIQKIVQSFFDETLISVKQPDFLLQNDIITIRSGHHGENIDKEKVFQDIEALIKTNKGGTIEAPVVITYPNKLNAEDVYKRTYIDPLNASVKVENNNVTIIPHVFGASIDKTLLANAVSELENHENKEIVLPVIITKPEITDEDLQKMLFKDTLATMNSHFSTSTENGKNRGENIKIAVSKINGKILESGETFSFNEIVGPRTEEGGFKTAHTYVAGKIVDSIGGGICQVSSTLYNAVLQADLNVVERRNHMFTVSYVPFGQDATVSYNSVDFKFKNSTKWPVKIEAWVTKDNKVFFSMKGTNDYPGKTVIMSPKIIKTTEFKTKYIDDPTLPQGKTVVKQTGMKGYVVETYKIVKQDGNVVSETKMYTSVYKPLDQEILRGTKKTSSIDQPSKGTDSHSTGVDDADNPPAQ